MIGGWDCHAHLFGPYDRYPLAADRSYTPPQAIEAQYIDLLERLGLSHGVLVHPSAYGDDFSLLLHTLAARPSTTCWQWRPAWRTPACMPNCGPIARLCRTSPIDCANCRCR